MNFFNFEDPEVLERFTGPDFANYWKATYGFDYVGKHPVKKVKHGPVQGIDYDEIPTGVHCAKSENRYTETCLNILTIQKKDQDRREFKGRRCFLGDRLYSIPCQATVVAIVH